MYSVYVHTFPDNKKYVGTTSTDVAYRWGSNGCNYKNPAMKKAIKDAGWENVKHEVVATCLTEEEATEMERALIKKYNSADDRYGYNISLGGISSKLMSDSTKQKLREANLGKEVSKETRAKIGKYQKEIKRSEEAIQHMRNAQKLNFRNGNNAMHSPEARAKASMSLKGRQLDLHVIQSASEAKYHPVENIITKKRYKSVDDASKETGISRTTITRHCNNKNIHKPQEWQYIGEKGTKLSEVI